MPSKAVAGIVAVVGLAIMIGTAVPLSQELKKAAKDQSASRKNGLIAGVVIGTLMIVAGIIMFAMSSMGGAGANANVGGGGGNSKNTAAAAAIVAQDPLNIAANAAGQTEIKAAVNAQAAENLVEKASNAKKQLAQLKGIFASMKAK